MFPIVKQEEHRNKTTASDYDTKTKQKTLRASGVQMHEIEMWIRPSAYFQDVRLITLISNQSQR